jgi:hypothetical protein
MNRKQARIAGLLYLLASIPAFFAWVYVPNKLIVTGDATATANRVRASETLLRLSIGSELIGLIVFIFVVLALYQLFKSVSEKHALAMATLLLISLPISFLSVVNEMAALVVVAVPVSYQDSINLSSIHWPTYFSVCMARDLWSRKSFGDSGSSRLEFLSFDPVSFHASWATCSSLQVSVISPILLRLCFSRRSAISLLDSRTFFKWRNYR